MKPHSWRLLDPYLKNVSIYVKESYAKKFIAVLYFYGFHIVQSYEPEISE